MGAATSRIAWTHGQQQKRLLAVAPVFFGLQQACEGMVWLGIQAHPPPALGGWEPITLLSALTYLFFAYAFWPIWIPWAAVALMPRPAPGSFPLAQAIPILGLVPALLLWLPLLANPTTALPEQIGHSLIYRVSPWSELLPPLVGQALYAALIVVPLLLVPSSRVRLFGLTLLLAFGLCAWVSRAALTSVWCFASALLSAQILWILKDTEDLGSTPSLGSADVKIHA